MASFFPGLGKLTENAVAAVTNTTKKITDVFSDEKFAASIKDASKNIKKTKKLFTDMKDLIDTVFDAFSLKTIIKLKLISKAMKKLSLKGLVEGINNIVKELQGLDVKGVKKTSKGIKGVKELITDLNKIILSALLLSITSIAGAIVIIPGLLAAKLIIWTITKLFGSLGKLASGRNKRRTKGAEKSILMMAATFTLFALTLYVLGDVGKDKEMWSGMGAFVLLIGMTVGLLWLLGSGLIKHLTKSGEKSILFIGATFALFALTLYILGDVGNDKVMWSGMGAFAALVAMAVGIMWLLGSKKVKIESEKGALSLLIIGGAFVAFTVVLWLLNELDLEGKVFLNMLALAGIVAIAVGVMFLLSKFQSDVIKGATSLAIVAGAFLVFIADMAILNTMDIEGQFWIAFAALAAIVAVGVAVVFGLSFITGELIAGAAALAIVGVAFLVFTGVMYLVGMMCDKVDMGNVLEFIGMSALVMLAVVGLAVTAALALVASIVVLPAAIAVGAGLMAMAGAFALAAAVGDQATLDKVNLFIGSIDGTMSTYLGLSGQALKIEMFGSHIRDILVGMGQGLQEIGKAYDIVSKIDCDWDAVNEVIRQMIISTVGTFLAVSTMPGVAEALKDEERGGILGAIFGGSKPGTSTVAKVLGLTHQIGESISELAKGVCNMAELRVNEYDKNGKVKSTRQLTDADFELAGAGVAKIVVGFTSALVDHQDEILQSYVSAQLVLDEAGKVASAIGGFGEYIDKFATGQVIVDDPEKEGKKKVLTLDFQAAGDNIGKMFKAVVDGVGTITKSNLIKDEVAEDIKRIMEPISTMVDVCVKIQDKLSATKDRAGLDPAETISSLITKVVGSINDNLGGKDHLATDGAIDDLKKIGEALKVMGDAKADGLDKSTESLDKTVKSVNSVDASKLAKVNYLMQQMNTFAKGVNFNFEGIAKSINENLVTAVEKLHDVLEDTNKSLDKIKEASQTTATYVSGDDTTTMTGAPASTANPQAATAAGAKKDPKANLATTVAQIQSAVTGLKKAVDKIEKEGMVVKQKSTDKFEVTVSR